MSPIHLSVVGSTSQRLCLGGMLGVCCSNNASPQSAAIVVKGHVAALKIDCLLVMAIIIKHTFVYTCVYM